MLLFVFVGLLLLRFEDAKLLELLFQLPPRITRSPNFLSPHPTGAYMREKISLRNPQLWACAACPTQDRTDSLTFASGMPPFLASQSFRLKRR